MDEPLGNCIGNALEMAEVFCILAGEPLQGRLGDLVLALGEFLSKTLLTLPLTTLIVRFLQVSTCLPLLTLPRMRCEPKAC